MEEQELVRGIKVYVKPLATAPVIATVPYNDVVMMKRYAYDETHVILYWDDSHDYNFTLVNKKSEGPDATDKGVSKTFFGQCYIAGRDGEDITSVAEDVPAFITTLYIGGE